MFLEDFVKLKSALVLDEGSSLTLYLDSQGIPTIGIGHNLKTGGVSQLIVDLLFDADVLAALLSLSNRPEWSSLDSVRQAVLLNMEFQLGMKGLALFVKMWAAIAKKNYTLAAAEMRDSKWYIQNPQRAERLARQMESGKWAPLL
jgi:lysozyme